MIEELTIAYGSFYTNGTDSWPHHVISQDYAILSIRETDPALIYVKAEKILAKMKERSLLMLNHTAQNGQRIDSMHKNDYFFTLAGSVKASFDDKAKDHCYMWMLALMKQFDCFSAPDLPERSCVEDKVVRIAARLPLNDFESAAHNVLDSMNNFLLYAVKDAAYGATIEGLRDTLRNYEGNHLSAETCYSIRDRITRLGQERYTYPRLSPNGLVR